MRKPVAKQYLGVSMRDRCMGMRVSCICICMCMRVCVARVFDSVFVFPCCPLQEHQHRAPPSKRGEYQAGAIRHQHAPAISALELGTLGSSEKWGKGVSGWGAMRTRFPRFLSERKHPTPRVTPQSEEQRCTSTPPAHSSAHLHTQYDSSKGNRNRMTRK